MPQADKQFQSLVDQDKRIAMTDLADASAARNWQACHSKFSIPPARALCGLVMRDYGLFERSRAPQSFPDVPKR